LRFDGYNTDGFHDELFLTDGSPRPEARAFVEWIEGLSDGDLCRRRLTRGLPQQLLLTRFEKLLAPPVVEIRVEPFTAAQGRDAL
jgi:hypothetical protein